MKEVTKTHLVKEKHPKWFKLKLERLELLQKLSPEVIANLIFACFEYLQTGETPENLGPIESIAFAAFVPDLDVAWKQYTHCVTARESAKGESSDINCRQVTSGDINRYQVTSCDTEVNKEVLEVKEVQEVLEVREVSEAKEVGEAQEKRGCVSAKRPSHPRFVPPTVNEVAEFVRQRGSRVDPQGFIDFYASKGWMIGRNPMKDWQAACRNAESWERWQRKPDFRDRVKTAADYENGESFV